MVGEVVSTTLLAVIITKLVDLCRTLFDGGKNWPKWIWIVLPMAFGVAIALIYEVNVLAELGINPSTQLQGWAGQVLTGVVVGGFGSGWHEVFDALSSFAKSTRAATLAATKDLPDPAKRRVWGADPP
jgi:hypothetical protein